MITAHSTNQNGAAAIPNLHPRTHPS